METKRLFLAINFPIELKKSLSVMQQELKNHIGRIKWVEEENFHLTLKFLGEVPIDAVNEVTEALRRSVKDIKPFYITVKGLGVFPKINQARVIWLGVEEGKNDVVNLFTKIDSAIGEVGFKKENKVYKPHLTIGRCREPQFVDVNEFRVDFSGRCIVNSVDLMMSQLTQKGPNYTLIESVNLNQ